MENHPLISHPTKSELRNIFKLAIHEGWNISELDIDAYYSLGKEYFFIEKIGSDLIGGISAVKYKNNVGFLGLYVVDQAYRYKGLGWPMFCHALNTVENCHSLAFYGVKNRESDYSKPQVGFKTFFHTHRWVGKFSKTKVKNSKQFQRGNDINFQILEDYEFIQIGFRRAEYYKQLYNTKKVFITTISDSNIRGFGMIRPCHGGVRLGPLYAENKEMADNIIYELSKKVDKNMTIFVDVLAENEYMTQLMEKYNFSRVPEVDTAVMFKNNPLNFNTNSVYAVASLEIG